jgi:UDP-3-O-[3-hydroxymyristoyl] N-acetylglucosamine deacetylase
MNRKTLSKETVLKGIGLHTGAPCSMIFKPSQQGYISFVRGDMPGSKPIKAELASVVSTNRGTNLANGPAVVHTVEHVLSSANALGVTDLIVEMDGPEPPVMDGSALLYAQAMFAAGIKELSALYPVFTPVKKIEYKEGNISYTLEPAGKTLITFIFIREGHPLAARQEYTAEFTVENFLKEIAPARTFGFEEEIAWLRANNLAKGGTVDNCVIIQKDKFSIPLRFNNEMARHKILDMIGDLKLMHKALGPMHITCTGGGHKSNVRFGQMLEAQGS